MNNKGFTLIELLGCLVIVGIVFGLGFGMIRGTRSSTLTTIHEIDKNEIYNTAKVYAFENPVDWILDGDNIYTCVSVRDMVDSRYFKDNEVSNYINKFVKVIKNNETKVITDLIMLEECN